MLSWWWALPLGVGAGGAAVLSVLASRLRREAAAVQDAVRAGRSQSGPGGSGVSSPR